MKKFIALAAMGTLLLPTAAVFAQEPSPDTSNIAPLCGGMVNIAENRLASNETRHADNVTRMEGSIAKLEEFMASAAESGADTSGLATDIANLEAVLVELEADHQAVQDNLTAMTQLDCSSMTQEEHDAYITEAKALFEELKSNIETIKEIRFSIKTHIEEILAELLSLNNPNDSETSS